MRLIQFISIIIYGLLGIWYVAPWLKKLGRAEALIALLWVHVFRYTVVYIFVAQREGYKISDVAAMQIAVGDIAGAIIAFLAILLLRSHFRLGIALCWLLFIETIIEVSVVIHQRSIEPPRADATGLWWFVFTFYASIIPIAVILMVWQLYTRRGESLEKIKPDSRGPPALRRKRRDLDSIPHDCLWKKTGSHGFGFCSQWRFF